MNVVRRIRERRLVQFVVAYLAAGWVGLEVIGSFVERQVLPDVIFTVGLAWYLAGIPVALLVGWYHGEKGNQKAPKWELAAIGLVTVALAGFSAVQVRQHRSERQAMSAEADAGRDLGHLSAVLPFRGADASPSPREAVGAGSRVPGTLRAGSEGLRLEIRLIDSASGTEYGRASLLQGWDDIRDGSPLVVEELAGFLRSRTGEGIPGRTSRPEAELGGR